MKRIVISLEAEAALDDILIHTIERWSQAQAEIYIGQLTERLRALASGAPPHARPCELLMQGKRTATGLSYYREGSHFLILRETAGELQLVEIFHERMNLDRLLEELKER